MNRKIFLLSMTLFVSLSFFTPNVLTEISVDEPDSTVEELMEKYKLGDFPLDPEIYQKYIRIWPSDFVAALPPSYDARNDGIVTLAKDQGDCGSCWAFASVGGFESSLLKEHSIGPEDLSEQQQVSCNDHMNGCIGGNSSAPRYWETTGPVTESCFPYTALDTTPCSYPCDELPYYVINWHTVTPTTEQLNASLYNDGPNYWRFDVYSDFYTFWNTGNPGDVYTQSWGSFEGGHAVLLIGWDDSKGAFLCKNSWGQNTGPNDDGTFWIAYSGHAINLRYGMSNFDTEVMSVWDYCVKDVLYATEYQFDRDGDIGIGQAIYPSPYFPAAFTGIVSQGHAYVAIKYLGNDTEGNLRFYELSTSTAMGQSWGIYYDTSNYYDGPRSAQMESCNLSSIGLSDGTDFSEPYGPEELIEWDFCFRDTNFIDEYYVSFAAGIVRGRAITFSYDAPLTGYVRGGYVYFAVGYPSDRLRFYKVATSTGAGTTWGINPDGTYYDPPHSCQIVSCTAAQIDTDLPTGGRIK